MIILIAGPSHTGKTALAQKMLEQTHYPYLSIDHLKMGLIRSGCMNLSPLDSDELLTTHLWPIVRELIKTAIENAQNLIVEGCYIPVDWDRDFEASYRTQIRCIRLIMSESYIRSHFADIKAHASIIEKRLDDSDCTVETLLRDNRRELEKCLAYGAAYHYIDTGYDVLRQIQLL